MSTPAITQQASRAVWIRCSCDSFGVMAKKAGTVAIGSTMTKSELIARKVYSNKLMRRRGPGWRLSSRE